MELNYAAILVATVVAFVMSSAWYGMLGNRLAQLNDAYAHAGSVPAWKVLVELLRSLVVAAVLAALTEEVGVESWSAAATLGLVVWIGFPAIVLTGSVVHEDVPWKLAAIHAGDWLFKLMVIALIVGLWT
jgi:hypothetical protein